MSPQGLLGAKMGAFGAAAVGNTTKPCPCAKPKIHIVDDGGDPATSSAKVESKVEVSNRVTNDTSLPRGFLDPSDDRDNFKIEVIDATITGASIPAAKVVVEVLRKNKKPFKPPRKINIELKRVGKTNVFRSRYIRAVVDDEDQKSVPKDQTILTDWDEDHPLEEILGQVVRATYSSAKHGKVTWEATVGNAKRMYIRLAVHILRKSPGAAGVVTIDEARMRVRKWFRRIYAQISLAPYLLNTHYVDRASDILTVSNSTGASATGGTTSSISFTITSNPKKGAPVVKVIGPHRPLANDTPIVTANHIVTLITATKKFHARAVQNPRLQPTFPNGSADVIITDMSGGRVTITNLIQTDSSQKVTIGRISTNSFEEYNRLDPLTSTSNGNWIVGSMQMRAMLQAYDSGSDRIDVFVIGEFAQTSLRGCSLIQGKFHPDHQNLRSIPKVKMSAFLKSGAMDNANKFPFAFPHECGHDLLDLNHAEGDDTELMMKNGTSENNAVDASKRFSESPMPFDFLPPYLSSDPIQEDQIRTLGALVMKPIP